MPTPVQTTTRTTRTSDLVRAARRESVTRTPGLVHAPGRALAAGVPRPARGHPDARVVHAARPRHRDHAAARAPPRRRRRHLLQRHRRAAQGDRRRPRHRAGRRARRGPSRSATASRPRPARPADPRARPLHHRGRGPARRASSAPSPLIGFAGAPFTLASYLVEGGPSKNHEKTKALMHGDPELWDALCARLAQISGEFLRVQARGRRERRPALRLLGRRPVEGRLRRPCDAALRRRARSRRRPRRAAHPLRSRHRRAAPA